MAELIQILKLLIETKKQTKAKTSLKRAKKFTREMEKLIEPLPDYTS